MYYADLNDFKLWYKRKTYLKVIGIRQMMFRDQSGIDDYLDADLCKCFVLKIDDGNKICFIDLVINKDELVRHVNVLNSKTLIELFKTLIYVDKNELSDVLRLYISCDNWHYSVKIELLKYDC